jgi:hypothetical protein
MIFKIKNTINYNSSKNFWKYLYLIPEPQLLPILNEEKSND